MRKLPLIGILAWLSACTAAQVTPLDDELQVEHVCIQRNAAVIRGDLLPTIIKGFDRHGISTEVFEGSRPADCEFIVTYTGTQTWDLAMVLKDAEVWIHKEREQVAYGQYHLKGGGGFSLTKWQGAEKKILPVMDALLEEYPVIDQG